MEQSSFARKIKGGSLELPHSGKPLGYEIGVLACGLATTSALDAALLFIHLFRSTVLVGLNERGLAHADSASRIKSFANLKKASGQSRWSRTAGP
jgi:hypothetical protein